jgi:hypothetical protein
MPDATNAGRKRLMQKLFYTILALTAAGLEATASAPVYVSVPKMIGYAEAIGIGTVSSLESMGPESAETYWQPNASVTVNLDELLRGRLPATIKAAIRRDNWSNTDLKIGDQVLIFVHSTDTRERHTLDGHADVFEAAQGFIPVDSIPPEAVAAIRRSIEIHQPEANAPRLPGQGLPDAAAEPFFDLLKSSDVRVRRWAMNKTVSTLAVTVRVREVLVAALEDSDVSVRRGAASWLAFQEYGWKFKLMEWRPPEDDPIAAKMDLLFHADELLRGLTAGLPLRGKIDAMAEQLAQRTASEASTRPYRFRASQENGVVPILAPGQDTADPVIQFVIAQFRFFDWKRIPRLPLVFQLDAWTDDKAYPYIFIVSAD